VHLIVVDSLVGEILLVFFMEMIDEVIDVAGWLQLGKFHFVVVEFAGAGDEIFEDDGGWVVFETEAFGDVVGAGESGARFAFGG
jgi:hypothetical protein